jgi:CDP-diacylglycerol--glycerol-3-phosphate 3-phosphatidyltransferase
MWYRDFLQQVIYKIINPLIKGMIKIGITPNIVTTLGFIGNIVAAAFFIYASQEQDLDAQTTTLGWGGFIIIASGLFDMMDGRLARMGNMSSSFGAMWDSTLDRYSELVSLFGIVLVFLEDEGWFWMGVVTFAAMVGSVMVSYVRARAEGLGIECKVGLMQRPERVVVTAITAMITGFTGNLWWVAGGMILIAVLANITAFWRVGYCYKKLTERDKEMRDKE